MERSSPPLLTVLLLLTGEQQEEGDGASEREDGTSGVWALRGSFFVVPESPWSVWVEAINREGGRLKRLRSVCAPGRRVPTTPGVCGPTTLPTTNSWRLLASCDCR